MPTILYLTTHQSAKWARLTMSGFIAYRTSLGLSGGCEQMGTPSLLVTSFTSEDLLGRRTPQHRRWPWRG